MFQQKALETATEKRPNTERKMKEKRQMVRARKRAPAKRFGIGVVGQRSQPEKKGDELKYTPDANSFMLLCTSQR